MGHIEVDETYFGGRQKGKRGRGAAGKTPVIGLIQRNGAVRTIAIPNVKSATLQALVNEHVAVGSTIYTDGWQGYRGLDNSGFSHKLISHDKAFVSSNGNHTNSIEGYRGYSSTNSMHDTTRYLLSDCLIIWLSPSLSSTSEIIGTS